MARVSARAGENAPAAPVPPNPPADCPLCPRLVEFREANALKFPDYVNAPAPTFGAANPSLLIVGLAPGLHGANKTGRPFTGDYAGDLLYATLGKFGFSNNKYDSRPDDGLKLKGVAITNAVRCVPPQNKPVGEEIRTCRPFLVSQIDAFPKLRAILCLGKISHDSTVSTLGMRQKDAPFIHAARHDVPGRAFKMFDSYHCSRYNTNTRRLTEEMFENVFAAIRKHVDNAR